MHSTPTLRLERSGSQVPTTDERNWAVFCHLAAVLGFFVPLGNIGGPLLIWQLKRKESAYVDYHGCESVNFQISISLYLVISAVLVVFQIGLLLLPCVVFVWGVGICFAAVRASQVTPYRYPFTIRLLS